MVSATYFQSCMRPRAHFDAALSCSLLLQSFEVCLRLQLTCSSCCSSPPAHFVQFAFSTQMTHLSLMPLQVSGSTPSCTACAFQQTSASNSVSLIAAVACRPPAYAGVVLMLLRCAGRDCCCWWGRTGTGSNGHAKGPSSWWQRWTACVSSQAVP